jgi:hypothetical protein
MLVVGAAFAAETAVAECPRPRPIAIAVGVLAAALVGAVSALLPEAALGKRVLLVIVPVVVAVALVIVAARPMPRRGLRLMLGAALALGLGTSVGHDFRAAFVVKQGVDDWLDAFERVVPERFAFFGLIGFLPDDLLTTTVTRDVRYGLVYRADEMPRMRPILEAWRDEGRPIYVMWDGEPPDTWPDVTFEKVEAFDRLYLVSFH